MIFKGKAKPFYTAVCRKEKKAEDAGRGTIPLRFSFQLVQVRLHPLRADIPKLVAMAGLRKEIRNILNTPCSSG